MPEADAAGRLTDDQLAAFDTDYIDHARWRPIDAASPPCRRSSRSSTSVAATVSSP
ncbi:hypothetical protein V2J56_02925 [Georgenia sp. MJ206]|uniref:hypothetical protein n=1 Tax=Georgenia wangjunii TaxID=3117730 RepID=UPI002F268F88